MDIARSGTFLEIDAAVDEHPWFGQTTLGTPYVSFRPLAGTLLSRRLERWVGVLLLENEED